MTGSIALGRAIAPVSAGAADNRRRGRTLSPANVARWPPP